MRQLRTDVDLIEALVSRASDSSEDGTDDEDSGVAEEGIASTEFV